MPLLSARSAFALAIASGFPAAAGDLAFTERAQAVGLLGGNNATNTFGLQFMAGGAGVGDFDRDGDQDIFFVGGSAGVDQLYINAGDGTFSDQAAAWGVATAGQRHTGVCVGDYNNDGWLDVMVTCVVEGDSPVPAENRLYRNNGDNTFTDVAAQAGVRFTPRGRNDSFSSAFGDYDKDGDLDLLIAGWFGGNHLYTNNGDGTFTAEPDSVFGGEVMDLIRGYAVRFTDINNDTWPDILLAADFFTSKLFINNADGTFTNATQAWGAGLDSNGMGHCQGDFNNDGLIDWYVTSRIAPGGTVGSGNMLYMNNGNETFTERSVPAGVNFGHWGWGADAVDFDHDGWLDIVATNGWNGSFFSVDPTHLWRNLGTGAGDLTEITSAAGITHTGQGRGLLTFDADNDGDRDLLIANNDQPLTYYENQLSGADINALTLFFDTEGDPALPPDGFGVRVEIDANGTTQLREMDGGSNYLAQSELSVHAGLGAASAADEVRVTWPDGRVTVLENLSAGRHTVTPPTASGCNPADLTGDGVLDLADIQTFIGAFVALDDAADLAEPLGVWDLADVQAFLGAFVAGCP